MFDTVSESNPSNFAAGHTSSARAPYATAWDTVSIHRQSKTFGALVWKSTGPPSITISS